MAGESHRGPGAASEAAQYLRCLPGILGLAYARTPMAGDFTGTLTEGLRHMIRLGQARLQPRL